MILRIKIKIKTVVCRARQKVGTTTWDLTVRSPRASLWMKSGRQGTKWQERIGQSWFLVPPVPHAKYFLTWILVLSVSVKRPLPCCVSSCSPFSYSPHLISQEEIQHGPLYLQAVLCLWACVHSGRVRDDGSAQKTPPAPWVPAWRPAPSWEALSEGSSDSLSGRARPEGLWLRKVPLTRVDTQAKGIFTKRS